MSSKRHYTANMMKGGAMVQECLALLDAWEPGLSPIQFLDAAVEGNLIGKSTRSRVRDILRRVFFRRFTSPELPSGELIKTLIRGGQPRGTILKLLYFHTALADDLLYDYSSQHLYDLYGRGQYELGTADAVEFIDSLTGARLIDPPWSYNIKVKTARGMLATLRDFGLLEGKARKRFTPAHLPMSAFLYVAYRLKDEGVGGARLLDHAHWHLYLLDPTQVERLFIDAHQQGHLGYYAAGGVVRVEWRYDGLQQAVRAISEGAD